MALPNGDLITTVFDPQMAYPVDKRMQVDTLNSRDSISMFIRWEGMTVYVLEDSKIYILQGGRSNEFWRELGLGSGTGGTTFVGQFETADLLPTSGRSAGDYAFVGTGDDFVQYNWDNISGQWVMAEGQTDMASEFFHIGYKTPLRRPVIFPLFPKDVLVETSGDFVFAPATAVSRFIFVGEVDAIRGVEYATEDREIKLVNRTGSDIPLRDKASGIPIGSGMDFGGTDYTWINGSEITLKGNGIYWQLAPNNQVAFSDHLDSVNAQVSVGSDGLSVITDVYDRYTGNQVQFKEISGSHTADGIVIVFLNGKYFRRTDKEYYIESFGVLGVGNDSQVFQKALDGIPQTESKRLIIDGYSLYLTTLVTKTIDNLILEFRNGAKITQSVQSDIITQQNLFQISGTNNTFINLHLDGNFSVEGMNSTGPSPKGWLCKIDGDNNRLLGRTVAVNSSGYNLDLTGDGIYIEDLFNKNNGYAGCRWVANKNCKSFRVGKYEGIQILGPRGRKTGITINGQNYVDLIQIDTYVSHNAGLFTEAEVGGPGTPYYKNIKIGTFITNVDQDTHNPDGTPAVNNSGKMENVANIEINKFICDNVSPSNNGQGYWFHQTSRVDIKELYTNCGLWMFGKSTHIGIFKYILGNTNPSNLDTLLRISPSIGEIVVDRFECEIPVGVFPYAGIFFVDGAGKKFTLNSYHATEEDIGLYRATAYLVPEQIKFGGRNIDRLVELSIGAGAFKQSVSIPVKKSHVSIPTSITRDVTTGEVFVFTTQTTFTHWVVRQSGTSSWSGDTFTGTATFNKYFLNINYSGTPLNNFVAMLTSNDVGLTAMVNGALQVWDGTAFKLADSRSGKTSSTSNYNTINSDKSVYFHLTRSTAGTFTVISDTFSEGDELIGEVSGGDKTFVAGAGVTLRYSESQGLTAPNGSRFFVKFQTANDALVTIIKPYSSTEILSATATLNFPVIAIGETATLTATVTGAALLDPVLVSAPASVYNANNSTVDAWVSAANTVTVRISNNGASSIDPDEGQFKIRVFK